jgi:hypothetical protein
LSASIFRKTTASVGVIARQGRTTSRSSTQKRRAFAGPLRRPT